MQKATITVRHEAGLHARPAAQFVKLAKQYKSDIFVSSKGKKVSAKSMVLILTLGVNQGSEIEISAVGEDEQEAVSVLVGLIEGNFPEL